jgi:hypothetical protein
MLCCVAMLCHAVLCCQQDAGGSDQPLPPALLHLVSYLCPNELELAALTGSSTDTLEQVCTEEGEGCGCRRGYTVYVWVSQVAR